MNKLNELDLEILIFFIGIYYILLWIYRWLCLGARTIFGTKCTTQRYGKDSWAIVTGGTNGLGKAAINYLSNEGFNIIIIAQN